MPERAGLAADNAIDREKTYKVNCARLPAHMLRDWQMPAWLYPKGYVRTARDEAPAKGGYVN